MTTTVQVVVLRIWCYLTVDMVLRPWTREDAKLCADASADPASRRYNGHHDRHGQPGPIPSIAQAQTMIEVSRPWTRSRSVAHRRCRFRYRGR